LLNKKEKKSSVSRWDTLLTTIPSPGANNFLAIDDHDSQDAEDKRPVIYFLI
jgi:hypothetical protein